MIPNKSIFKFQELTPITGVKPYVIRFWETEFPEIAPENSDSGQKLYGRKDVEVILEIKKLLFDQKLSIPEAKATLRNKKNPEVRESTPIKEEIVLSPAPERETSNALIKDTLLLSLNLIKDIRSKHKW